MEILEKEKFGILGIITISHIDKKRLGCLFLTSSNPVVIAPDSK
jgi:hypothetical protein